MTMNNNRIAKFNKNSFKRWAENKKVKFVESSEIILIEKIHLRCANINLFGIFRNVNKARINSPIVIRELLDGQKVLVSGLKQLMMAKALNKPIATIMVGKAVNHKKLAKITNLIECDIPMSIPESTEAMIDIDNIIIPWYFENTAPSKIKMKEHEAYFSTHGGVDVPVEVYMCTNNRTKFIVNDKYIRFLILKNKGIKYIPVIIK